MHTCKAKQYHYHRSIILLCNMCNNCQGMCLKPFLFEIWGHKIILCCLDVPFHLKWNALINQGMWVPIEHVNTVCYCRLPCDCKIHCMLHLVALPVPWVSPGWSVSAGRQPIAFSPPDGWIHQSIPRHQPGIDQQRYDPWPGSQMSRHSWKPAQSDQAGDPEPSQTLSSQFQQDLQI